MKRLILSIITAVMVIPFLSAAEKAVHFPAATPESQGMSREALSKLAGIVNSFVEDESIVGAELLVVKNRRTVLHEGFGWKDEERELRMEPGTLFNIRSMTKPITGTAVQMLIDDGELSLEDSAADFLEAFDNEKSRAITVEQLLTHRSGLPMSFLTSLDGLTALEQIATQAGENGPTALPGTAFVYSDAGSDVLGAIIESASGEALDRFTQERIMAPLGMRDTCALVKQGDPIATRISSAYVGGRRSWTRYYASGGDVLYPFAMGSQSIFCSPSDYARFLTLWMDDGMVDGEQLLSQEAVRRGLTPTSDMNYPTGFSGLKVRYGQMWQLWLEENAAGPESARPVVFGHGGSDGTWAWAFPEEDLIILYFTQSRGQATGISLEGDIDRLLLHPGRHKDAGPNELEPFLGTYFDGPSRFEILVRGGVSPCNCRSSWSCRWRNLTRVAGASSRSITGRRSPSSATRKVRSRPSISIRMATSFGSPGARTSRRPCSTSMRSRSTSASITIRRGRSMWKS